MSKIIQTGTWDGQPILRQQTVREELLELIPQLKDDGVVMTAEDAEDLYYKTNDCVSDDSDAELARIERWCEKNNITITD